MNIKIICIGKIKESYLSDAISEYSKRISKYANLNIIELPDSKIPTNPSDKEIENVKNVECDLIKNQLGSKEYIIALNIDGKQISSEEFANKFKDITLNGYSTITFIIGGSLGLNEQITNMANMSLSFSKMTFPHQLFRTILLEQIYRAFKINSNETYHK